MEFISLQETLDLIAKSPNIISNIEDAESLQEEDSRFKVHLMPSVDPYFGRDNKAPITRGFYNDGALGIYRMAMAAAVLNKLIADEDNGAKLWVDIGETGLAKRAKEHHEALMDFLRYIFERNDRFGKKSYPDGKFAYSFNRLNMEFRLSESDRLILLEKGFYKEEVCKLVLQYTAKAEEDANIIKTAEYDDLCGESEEISNKAFYSDVDAKSKSEYGELSNSKNMRKGKREDDLDPVIEDAIKEAGGLGSLMNVFLKLKQYALDEIYPFTGIVNDDGLQYFCNSSNSQEDYKNTNGVGRKFITQKAMMGRLYRRKNSN